MAEEEEEDRLSSLPDAILIEILSRLPITSAAATSVLSHRWRHLWTGVTRFKYLLKGRTPSSAAIIVNRILRQLTSPKLNAIDLDLSLLRQLPKSIWLTEVCRQNVDHLTINAQGDFCDSFSVPSCLFTFQSLVTLTLYGQLIVDFGGKIQSNHIIIINNLPNLKSLTLDTLTVFSPVWLVTLIKSCPLLESLNLALDLGDVGQPVDSVEISSPNLKFLKIHAYIISITERTKFYIDAPKLENLDVSDRLSLYYLVETPSTLVKACIDIGDLPLLDGSDKDYLLQMSKFVIGLSSVTNLELNICASTNLFDCYMPMPMPIFPSLTHFELTLVNISLNCWTNLLLFLQCTPNLTHLAVTMLDDRPFEDKPWDWCAPDSVPNCWVTNLKTMRIEGLKGMDSDLKLLAYILNYALVLEQLHVSIDLRHVPEPTQENLLVNQWRFCRSLFKLPRSSTCDVVFSGPSIKTSTNAYEEGFTTCKLYLG